MMSESRNKPQDPVEEEEPQRSERVDFPCGNCGADMTWDPAADALTCEYCDHRVDVPRGEGTIVEHALEDAGSAARGLGLEMRVARCANCGARVAFEGASTAENCVYCGSSNVLAQDANRNALRPESLVPLDVSRAEVRTNFERWLHGLWFRPNALKKAQAEQAMGVYVPYWTFDCQVRSDWSADAGHYYYVTKTYTVTVNGKRQTRTRQERRVRWVPAWGARDDAYDDHLVAATEGLPRGLVAKLGGFKTTELAPYKPEYLAGWCAEEYQVDLEQGWEQGQGFVVQSQRERCSADVPGDTQRNLRVANRISNVRWKHVLLPIWSLQYRYGGKVYTVLVNGQTGTVAGKAPLSWVKILLAVLGVGLAAGAVAVVAGR